MTTLADNGLHIRPRVHNWSTTKTIRATTIHIEVQTFSRPPQPWQPPSLGGLVWRSRGRGVGRSALPGEREEESVRVLCVARTSLRYVFNTPIQVFNLFGNKRDTFKISMHKTVRITSVECQRHHYILYKTIGGDLIFHLRCIPRDKCANNCAQ